MIIDIEQYIRQLILFLKQQFADRLVYVGLQGSYLRGEATDDSDIDIMVVIDRLSTRDLRTYRCIIESMDHADKSCGFICSKDDLKNWNPLEICHLTHTTKDYFGTLSDLVPPYTRKDICNYVKLSINNLYHELCHRYIHADADSNITCLTGTYKAVFFILQSLCYLRSGIYVATKNEMLTAAEGTNRQVLQRSIDLGRGISHDFEDSFDLLFNWCQEKMAAKL